MKHTILLTSCLGVLFLAACSAPTTFPQNTGDLVNSGGDTSTLPPDAMPYSENLIVTDFWAVPESGVEENNEATTLTLTAYFEEYTEILFLPRTLWNNYLDPLEDTTPGNGIFFSGWIVWLDAGAGSHYYQVVQVEALEKITTPTQDEVEAILNTYNYCEQDSDCASFYGDCPLSCHLAVNKDKLELAQQISQNFASSQEPQCMYGCNEIVSVSCENYQCVPQGRQRE